MTEPQDHKARLSIRTRLYCGDEIAIGPGKAALLEAIASEGSISGAGRVLGMSYRRTWMLVDTMNRCWQTPLVETAAGGSKGGGAHVTDLGRAVIDQYRAMERAVAQAAKGEAWERLEAALLPRPRDSQKG
jgi:molybdate transport system regulatory protein